MNIMLPTNEQFVVQVAKAIGRDRLFREAVTILEAAVGTKLPDIDALEKRFDAEFDHIWNGPTAECQTNRERFCDDAMSAINRINLLLLTMPE